MDYGELLGIYDFEEIGKKIFKCMELLGLLFYLGIFMKIMEE